MSVAMRHGRLSPQHAYARWTEACAVAGWRGCPAPEEVHVADGRDRVLAEPVRARWPSPRCDCAAMDGIAIAGPTAAREVGQTGADHRPRHQRPAELTITEAAASEDVLQIRATTRVDRNAHGLTGPRDWPDATWTWRSPPAQPAPERRATARRARPRVG